MALVLSDLEELINLFATLSVYITVLKNTMASFDTAIVLVMPNKFWRKKKKN